MKWEPEQGGRVHQQQLQASSKFKGDAKDLQACGFWKQNLLGMGRVGKKLNTKHGVFVVLLGKKTAKTSTK